MKIKLNIYIVKEIAIPYILSLLAFTFMFMINNMLKMADLTINKGVRLKDIGILIIYLTPSLLVYTIPMATLLGVLFAFNRLSADREIIAFKTSGINVLQLLKPVLLIGLFSYIVTAVLMTHGVARSKQAYYKTLVDIAKHRVNIGIKEGTFNGSFGDAVVYVKKTYQQGNVFEGVFISRTNVDDSYTIIAKQGQLLTNPLTKSVVLRLKNGSIHRAGSDYLGYQKFDFYTYDFNLSLLEDHYEGKHTVSKRFKEMDFSELLQIRKTDKKDTKLLMEINKRLAFPFACIVFSILALPLAIETKPTGKFRSFTIAIVIILIYYIILSTGEYLSRSEILPPFVGLWLPNIILLVYGGVLMYYKNQFD